MPRKAEVFHADFLKNDRKAKKFKSMMVHFLVLMGLPLYT